MKIVQKYNPCKSCICRRCNCLFCPYEKYFSCYPANAGCVYCMMQENDKPVLECPNFHIRSTAHFYKVRARRKNPYQGIARLISALHNEIKKL